MANVSMSNVNTLGGLTTGYEQERQDKYSEGLKYLKQILKMFGPSYGKGVERKMLSDTMAGFVSSGMAPTTLPTAVSAGIKSQTEDIRKGRLADALAMFTQYIQQSSPTPGLVSQTGTMANQAFRNPGALNPVYQRAIKNIGMSPRETWYSTPGVLGAYTGI